MPVYTAVVASRIEKYRAQLERENGNDADIDAAILKYVICQLVDAAFGGGGGGGGSTSALTIAQGINQSTDIDAIVAKLTTIDANQINQSSVKAAIDSSIDIDAILTRLQSIDTKAVLQSDIVAAIQSAADIDALIARLQSIDNKIPLIGTGTIATSQSVSIASDQVVNIRDRSTVVPIAQVSISLLAGGTDQYIIPANARSVTICITSGSLVHFTEDGTIPTTTNCWFAGGSKEIWDYAVPAGATLRLLAVSAATISIQARV